MGRRPSRAAGSRCDQRQPVVSPPGRAGSNSFCQASGDTTLAASDGQTVPPRGRRLRSSSIVSSSARSTGATLRRRLALSDRRPDREVGSRTSDARPFSVGRLDERALLARRLAARAPVAVASTDRGDNHLSVAHPARPCCSAVDPESVLRTPRTARLEPGDE